MNLLRKYYDGLADWPSGGQTDKPTGEELNCMVCGKEFIGEEPKMCCSGRECGCMGLPIDPIVCSKECYDKLPLPSAPLTPIYDNIVEVMNEAENNKPTGVPEDVKQKIRDRYPYYLLTSDTVGSLGSSNDSLEPFREAAAYGYSLALPELTAKEEEIKGKNNTISIMNKVINSQIEFIKELKEENAKLKEEVERLKKDVIDVLSENHQAQIAGYYNDDKTDAEREKRNAVIEEYSDLLIIFKARFNSPTTKK